MTISKDLFLSILSMDAYNRGYNPGIAGLAGPGTRIGNAVISDQSDVDEGTPGVTASFYAISYTLTAAVGVTNGTIAEGTTIISYRGTDQIGAELVPVDLPISWGGSYDQTQIELALKFFKTVDATNGTPPMH